MARMAKTIGLAHGSGGTKTRELVEVFRRRLGNVVLDALDDSADLSPAALGLELIHNFSLIHDDVQDDDKTRRGRPTVWSRYGVAQAINAGDLMQSLAVAQALRVGQDAAKTLLAATIEMIEGQGLDLDAAGQAVGVKPYLEMIDKKTGTATLFAFDKGQGLSEHTTPFDALVLILDGTAEITISGTPHKLTKGQLIIMPANQPHAVRAIDKFKMLLIMIRS